jgi:putative phosphoribosyl transferase
VNLKEAAVIELPLEDRVHAGRELAGLLHKYADSDDVIVLALPRGGVPVAYEIASALKVALDLMTVRKLGLPQHEELAMGAIASGGVRVLNSSVVDAYNIANAVIDDVARREEQELTRRERAYRGDRAWPGLEGKRVILVDDGIATGSTMRAAIEATRTQNPAKIVLAVPVAAESSWRELCALVDECICLATPAPFRAVGQWYVIFGQTSDDDVRALLARAWQSNSE